MYAAYEYEKLCSGKLMDIMKFMEALNNDNCEAMKNCINWP